MQSLINGKSTFFKDSQESEHAPKPPTPPAQSSWEKRFSSPKGKMDSVLQQFEALKTSLSVMGPLQTTVKSRVDSVRKLQASACLGEFLTGLE